MSVSVVPFSCQHLVMSVWLTVAIWLVVDISIIFIFIFLETIGVKAPFHLFAFNSCIILGESLFLSLHPSLLLSASLPPSLSHTICVAHTKVYDVACPRTFLSQRRCQASGSIAFQLVPTISAFFLKRGWCPASPSNPPVSPPSHSTEITSAHGHTWLLK